METKTLDLSKPAYINNDVVRLYFHGVPYDRLRVDTFIHYGFKVYFVVIQFADAEPQHFYSVEFVDSYFSFKGYFLTALAFRFAVNSYSNDFDFSEFHPLTYHDCIDELFNSRIITEPRSVLS